MAGWWCRHGPGLLRDRLRLPERHVRLLTTTTTTAMAVATSVVGVGVVAVAGSAVRGHDRPLRAATAVFTAHAVGHLASSSVLRSYTPGAVSATTVVLPWGAWALRRLGPPDPTSRRRAAADRAVLGAGTLALAVAGHALGRRVA